MKDADDVDEWLSEEHENIWATENQHASRGADYLIVRAPLRTTEILPELGGF
jgi:hypothetical protein